MKHKKIIIFVLVAFFGILLIAANSFKQKKAAKQVDADSAQKRDMEIFITCSGRVSPEEETKIKAPVSERVIQCFFEEGDTVEKGILLYVLDDRELLKQRNALEAEVLDLQIQFEKIMRGPDPDSLISAENSLEKAQNYLDVSKIKYDSAKELDSKGFISKAELENAKMTWENAELDYRASLERLKIVKDSVTENDQRLAADKLENARERLRFVNDDLTSCRIYSPVDGTVITRTVKDGDYAARGADMMMIADMSRLIVKTSIDEVQLRKIKPGSQVHISFEAIKDAKFEGYVKKIYPEMEAVNQISKAKVDICFDPGTHAIRKGLSADMDIIVNSANELLSVPIEAVYAEDGDSFVYKILGHKTALKTKVKTGMANDQYIEILHGLEAGDEVVTFSVEKLESGDQLSIKEQKEQNNEKPEKVAETNAAASDTI